MDIIRDHNSLTTHDYEYYTYDNSNWYYGIENIHWVGGQFPVDNLSSGYHAIQTQWWEHHAKRYENPCVLLVSESQKVKQQFEKIYPNWKILTLDMFYEITNNKPDIIGDVSSKNNPLQSHKFDIIINQATLEHVYNPFQAMENLCNALAKDGILITHTHPPGFGDYHRFPSDYFRFMKDWWYDLPKYVENIRLLYLHMNKNTHVFSCYQKVN